MSRKNYPTNLTEKQWQFIEKIVECQKRKRKHDLRDIMNAIIYLVKTGCQWRMLPNDFAPWNTVYFYYRKWKNEGVIEEVHEFLRDYLRHKSGRALSPSVGIIDSRSVKTSHHVDCTKGIDGGKKMKGRKQHIIVDTMGLLLGIIVHAANIHDSKGAMGVIEQLRHRFPRLSKIIADGGYRGELIDKVKSAFGWVLEVVMRKDDCPKFKVLPKRWIVERTFAWLENYRRLTIDYEFHVENSETIVQLAMIRLMLNRIN
jgi:Transposase and inactivated derivatives